MLTEAFCKGGTSKKVKKEIVTAEMVRAQGGAVMYLFDGVVHDALPIIDQARVGTARGCPFCAPCYFENSHWSLNYVLRI